MQPTELPQRAAATGPESSGPELSRSLRDDVVELARALPGELRRLNVRGGGCEIEVEWAPPDDGAGAARPAAPAGRVGDRPGAAPDAPEGTIPVRAPLVGTFYVSPSPGADPFVQVGDEVEAGATLAIVEAMKLMNPIVADEPGVVTEILVADAESVEYDQVLMLLRPTGGPR